MRIAKRHKHRGYSPAAVDKQVGLRRLDAGQIEEVIGLPEYFEAGDGARIVGHLNLADDNRLSEAAREAHRYGDDYLLEAWVEFLTVKLGGSIQQVVPSGHFRQGQVAEGITLQSLDGFAWRGNTYLDEAAWTRLGLPSDAYQAIRDALKQVRQAFLGSASITDGSHEGLVLGGIDFAVGRVGGRFTDLSGTARPDGGSAVCSNGLLHDEVLRRLRAGQA